MTTVILCNRLSRLKGFLGKAPKSLRFISLGETLESNLIRNFLRQRGDAEELPKAKLFRERSADFRDKYIRFMGELNVANRSPDWWAMRFTTKNPLATPLCRDTASFLLIAELARCATRPLLVITDSPDLAAQVEFWGRREEIDVVNLRRQPGVARRFLKRRTPVGIIRASLRTFLLWIRSRRLRPTRNLTDAHLVVTSVTHPYSFQAPNGYRDAYFGTLVQQLGQSNLKPLVLAIPFERPFQQLKSFHALKDTVPLVPLDACLTLGSLLACIIRCLFLSISPSKLQGSMEIDGRDISCLVQRSVADARHSGDMFLDMRTYYCAKWLARNIRVKRWLYPFENRAFEKMLLLGVESESPTTEMVGYQHASLTQSHTNFIFAPGESAVAPLPDSILTTGEVITNWLERKGNYPQGIFKTACALRQSQPKIIPEKTVRSSNPRVLVALATNIEEYVGALLFLQEAFVGKGRVGKDGFEVRIRPHPEYPLESALAIAPLAGPKFYAKSTGSLADDLEWADVVLYASSTVGLEAVSMGIPVVYIDLGAFLDTDPMYGWSGLRWSVKEPAELAETIQHITGLPQEELQTLQQKGREYAAAYLKPITASVLETFWHG